MNYDQRRNKTKSWNEYQSLHRWVAKNKGKASSCSFDSSHQSKRYHWSNISQEYKWDLDDFQSLCQSCHIKHDITPETRLLFSERSKNNLNAAKPIIREIDGELPVVYVSARYASKMTGVLTTSICNALKGTSKTAGGYKWRYYY